MRPSDERKTLEALRHLKKVAHSLSEQELLEVLAWDDQPNNTKDHDPISRAVRNLSKTLVIADDHYSAAINILKALAGMHPTPNARVSTLEDCIACGEPILGQSYGGLDDKCRKRFDRSGEHDRPAWVAKQRQSRADSILATDSGQPA